MKGMTSHSDPRVLRTRQLIKDAFVKLLEITDVQKISVNRIAELATINRVTFYLHYRDIVDMQHKMADEMVANIRNILSEHPLDTYRQDEIEAIFECLFEHIAEHADFYRLVLATKQIPIFTERLLGFLSEVITKHLEAKTHDATTYIDSIPTDIAVWYFSSALIGTMIAWLQNNMPYTPTFLAKQFALLVAK